MVKALVQYFAALVTVLGMDAIFLGVLAREFYRSAMRDVARFSPDGGIDLLKAPAAAAWLLIPLGIVLFVSPRAEDQLGRAAIYGALYGLVVYGIYDATNWATLKGWTAKLSLVDTTWGMIICATASVVATWAGRSLVR